MSGTGISKPQIPVIVLNHSLFQNKATKKTKGKRYTEPQANDTKTTVAISSRLPPPPPKKPIRAIKNNSIGGIIIFMEEFRIGSIEVVRAFNTLSHPYPDGEGRGASRSGSPTPP